MSLLKKIRLQQKTAYNDEIETNFANNPLNPDASRVYVGVVIDKDGDVYEIVTCNLFEHCVTGVIKLAKEIEKNLDAIALRERYMQMAFKVGRFGTIKGGLIATFDKESGCGIENSSFTICCKTIK